MLPSMSAFDPLRTFGRRDLEVPPLIYRTATTRPDPAGMETPSAPVGLEASNQVIFPFNNRPHLTEPHGPESATRCHESVDREWLSFFGFPRR